MSITAYVDQGYLIPVVELFPSIFPHISRKLMDEYELPNNSPNSWADFYNVVGQSIVNLEIVQAIEPTMTKLGFDPTGIDDVEDAEAIAASFIGAWRVVSFHKSLERECTGYFGIQTFHEPLLAFSESALYIVQRIGTTVVKVPTLPCIRLLLASKREEFTPTVWAFYSG